MQAGDQIPGWTMESVSREKMKTMAVLLHDSNLIHLDPAVVAALGLGDRPINQGPTNLAYIMNMLDQWSGGFDQLAGGGVRLLANVFREYRVTASSTVLSADCRTAASELRLHGPYGAVIQRTASARRRTASCAFSIR